MRIAGWVQLSNRTSGCDKHFVPDQVKMHTHFLYCSCISKISLKNTTLHSRWDLSSFFSFFFFFLFLLSVQNLKVFFSNFYEPILVLLTTNAISYTSLGKNPSLLIVEQFDNVVYLINIYLINKNPCKVHTRGYKFT